MKLSPVSQCPSQNEIFASTSEKLLKARYWTFPMVHCFASNLNIVSNSLSAMIYIDIGLFEEHLGLNKQNSFPFSVLATAKNFAVNAVTSSRTSQFKFLKYLIRVPKCKNRWWNQNLKVRKARKTNTKIVILKEKKKKRHWNRNDLCYMTFRYLLTYFMDTYFEHYTKAL